MVTSLHLLQELVLEKESQSRGSVVALVLVIATAFALVNFDKVSVVSADDGCWIL